MCFSRIHGVYNGLKAHTPRSVLALEIFNIPKKKKYIFAGLVMDPINKEEPSGRSIKQSKLQFTHKMLAQEPVKASGGDIRITDTTNFPISKTVSSATLASSRARCMRSLAPERRRVVVFHQGTSSHHYFRSGRDGKNNRLYGGDVGIVPQNMGHFIENLSDEEELEFLEIFGADKFQLLGETPKRMVAEHLFKNNKTDGSSWTRLSRPRRTLQGRPCS